MQILLFWMARWKRRLKTRKNTCLTCLTKLRPAAKHVFRFEGNKEVLPYLPELSKDALFLGYPYGLILADKLARISHQEQKSLSLQLLLKSDSQMISQYLQNANAHEILDTIG